MRVAIIHMEAYRFMTEHQKPLCTQIQELVNRGVVDHVCLSDHVSASVLVIRYPPILQFADRSRSRVRARRVIILANQAPAEVDGTDLRYVPMACTDGEGDLRSRAPVVPTAPQCGRNSCVSWSRENSCRSICRPLLTSTHGAETDALFTNQASPRHSRDSWTKGPRMTSVCCRPIPSLTTSTSGSWEDPRLPAGSLGPHVLHRVGSFMTTTRSMCDLSISDRLLRVLSASEHDRGIRPGDPGSSCVRLCYDSPAPFRGHCSGMAVQSTAPSTTCRTSFATATVTRSFSFARADVPRTSSGTLQPRFLLRSDVKSTPRGVLCSGNRYAQ